MYKYENDEIFAKFIKFMEISLYRKKIRYIKNNNQINNEKSIESIKELTINQNIVVDDLPELTNKEKYILEKLYIEKFSYIELSVLTNEKIETLKKRRYRAIQKLKKRRKLNE